MLGGLGSTELIIILVVALVIFGAGKLPEMGSALGKGIKNFKKGISDLTEDDKTEDEPKPKKIDDKK
jgi:sec-independent protein translocase protein TatA